MEGNRSRLRFSVVTCYFLFLFCILLYRITIGVDFSDESYYASFLTDWLKSGISHSYNLMLHATAAWLIYPFVQIYHNIVANNDAMILFLRFLYLIVSFLSALFFYRFAILHSSYITALLISGMIFLFIPWSLPSLSYNTIGMLAMLMALCLFGILENNKFTNKFLLLSSAFFWVISIIAYPTLSLVWLFFIVQVSLFYNKNLFLKKYVCLFLLISMFFLILLIDTFGLNQLFHMIKFSNSVNHVSDGWNRKMDVAYNLFLQNKIFLLLSLLAITIGLLRSYLSQNKIVNWITWIFLSFLIYFCISWPVHVLFLHSHDLIFLLALLGIYVPFQNLFRREDNRILAILYCTSLFAGLVTTFTAYNGLLNFHLGGLLAACLTLLLIIKENNKLNLMISCFMILGINVVMLVNDFRFIYGENHNPITTENVRIKSGVYAYLLTSTSTANMLHTIQTFLPQIENDKSLLVIGFNAGAYLLTPLFPKTLSTWTVNFSQNDYIDEQFIKFYQTYSHLPDYIFLFFNKHSASLSSGQQLLINKYSLVKEFKNSDVRLQLYTKKIQDSFLV